MYRIAVRTLIALSLALTACSAPPEGGSTLNFAAAFGWGGHADTDLAFGEFFAGDHTLVARFMPQHPKAYAGPVLAENGGGTFFVGQESHTQTDPRLVLAVGSQRRSYVADLTAETWQHLAVTRNGNTFQLYLDGQPLTPAVQVTPGDPNLPAGDATLRLARRTSGKTFAFDGDGRVPQFYGLVDDVALFDRALAPGEIESLGTDHLRLGPSLLGNPWNLAAAWTFDSATPSGANLPAAFARPVTFHSPADDGVTYEGVGEHLPAQKVPASQTRNAPTDAAFLLPPFHRSTYTLPFQPGQAWEIWFGNETLNSHFGYAAFTWDVRLATPSGDSHLEGAEPTSCDQPLVAIASGTVTSVDDDNYDPTEKDRANAVRFQAAPDERFSYLHIRDGSGSDAGLEAGDPVTSGQLVATVGTRQSDNCHLHFGVRSETVTIPVAFRDYEASDDQGQTWYHVDRGVPEHGQWVRNVGDNTAPSIQIVAPADGSAFWYGGLGEPFEAVVSDAEDGSVCCGVRWTSDLDGFLGTGTQNNLALSPGTHVVTAQAQDTQGATASDSISVTAENVPPTATIVTPEENATLYRDTPYVFDADVNDVNEPLADLCAATEWTSSSSDPALQGCAPQATFTSNGARTLTVTVTDEHGLSGTATVDVQVVDPPPTGPPNVTILQPNDGAGFDANTGQALEGVATDPDGGTPLSYDWYVTTFGGTDHAIGSGATLSWTPSDDVPFTCGGTQVDLRLEVTDPDGEVGQDEIGVFIAYPPC